MLRVRFWARDSLLDSCSLPLKAVRFPGTFRLFSSPSLLLLHLLFQGFNYVSEAHICTLEIQHDIWAPWYMHQPDARSVIRHEPSLLKLLFFFLYHLHSWKAIFMVLCNQLNLTKVLLSESSCHCVSPYLLPFHSFNAVRWNSQRFVLPYHSDAAYTLCCVLLHCCSFTV